ncbi:MAG: hypothetical protein EBT63_05980, partial [Proteobacteria bacterium]|nr:hypothetical protein [Pseudomonadota bacterium]
VLVEDLLKLSPNVTILFTTTTLSSAKILQEKIAKFNSRIIHQFLPVDSYFIVKKFLNYWRPRACIFVESEIWPNLIYCARQKAILSFLINARISEKSLIKWQKLKKIGFNIFDYFSLIFSQSLVDKKNLEALTQNSIFFEGNLKSQNAKMAVDFEKLAIIKNQIGNRKIWLCSSTHQGEESIIIETHHKLKQHFSDLITIIILRHPTRSEAVSKLLVGNNYGVRSKNDLIQKTTEFYVVDTLGELGVFYSLTNFIFLGGSLMPIGGHNPIEAMQFNCVVISGQFYQNNFELYENLRSQQACVVVGDSKDLFDCVKNFLSDEDKVNFYNFNAKKYLSNKQNTAKHIVNAMDRILLLKI